MPRRKKRRYFPAPLRVGLLVSALAGLCAPRPAGAVGAHAAKRFAVTVTHVFDGASFQIGGGQRSALIGVGAPPLHARGGKEALRFLRRLLEGQRVWVEIDERLVDKSGQTLYYVFLPDGTFVNALALIRGYGRAVIKYPNIRYRTKLIEAENTAKKFHRGLWGDEFPDPEREEEDFPAYPSPLFPRRRSLFP